MYKPTATSLDGSTDWSAIAGGLSGAADGKTGTFSFWFQKRVADSAVNVLSNTGNAFRAAFSASNLFYVVAENVGGAGILSLVSSTAVGDDAWWHHYMGSWDLANAKGHLFLDNVNVEDAGSTVKTNDTIDYTVNGWALGALTGGGQKFTGRFAEVYFALEYVDLTVAANRAKFITGANKPEDLGANGSTPTGSQPIVYFKSGNLSTNSGSGGNFTQGGSPGAVTGPITPRQAHARGDYPWL